MSSAKPLIILAIPRAPKSRPNPSMEPSSFFVSLEAATFYHEVVSKRKFVAERFYMLDALPRKAWCGASQLFTHYHLHTLNAISSHCPPVAAAVRTLKEPCVSDSEDSDATDSEMLTGASEGSLVF
ncbi:hypothetical protein L3X38_032046 [Prunus dulcis]|uniref:Uncharacterized protein n=1 Tax=Prunus dulcis TaxID=3755 RepID=A0AAD4YVN5_PRUDU|nr:hypothetical protein L3X38_032046 [Prunus dulcis]